MTWGLIKTCIHLKSVYPVCQERNLPYTIEEIDKNYEINIK